MESYFICLSKSAIISLFETGCRSIGMIIIFLTILASIAVLAVLGGLVNFQIQKHRSERIILRWFDPSNITSVAGIPTHVVTMGVGDPLIFVHGSQMNIYDWRFNTAFLAKHFKVYAIDMPGCGFTGKPDVDYSPDFFAQFIFSLMQHYRLDKASFVASSWGGGHVLHFALQHPEKVNRLVMSSPCGLPHRLALLDRVLALPVLGWVAALYGNRNLVKNELQAVFTDKSFVTEELIDSVCKPLFMTGGLRATVRSYQKADFTFVKDNLEKISAPVMLVWGSKDTVHTLGMLDEMQRRLPHCEVNIIDNVGHLPHEEASTRFNQLALEFLKLIAES
jgi:4,5:9,10-diseco-3-hydroxy-5,9,17-trioxoandrosta-1(10),2-diene-4-oate hydrolase